MGKTLLLETLLLNSFVDEDNWAYVKVGDKFVRKKARDLQEGDAVVIDNEAIHKTLEDVDPALEQSMRYTIAKRSLHETNRYGKHIKKFRILLLRNLAGPKTPNLEAKIMQENDDFTQREYAGFRRKISQYVNNVSERAVDYWLKGETLAPEDWDNFYRLGAISEELRAIADTFAKDSGFYADYQLYTGVRRTVMNHITKRTGKSGKTTKKTDIRVAAGAGQRGKYSQEIGIVVGYFAQEIDTERSVSRINAIKAITPSSKYQSGSNSIPKLNLKKGVHTGELNVPLVDINQIEEELYFLDNCLFDAVNRYTIKKFGIAPDRIDKTEQTNAIMGLSALPLYITTRLLTISPLEKMMLNQNIAHIISIRRQLGRNITENQINTFMEREYQAFLTGLQEGYVDDICGTKRNTVSHVIDQANHHRSAMPRAYFERKIVNMNAKLTRQAANTQDHSERKQRRELQSQVRKMYENINRLEKYLLGTYQLKPLPKLFFLTYHNELMSTRGDITTSQTPEQLIMAREAYEKQGQKFYTREEVIRAFERLGLPDAIRVYPQELFISRFNPGLPTR